MENFILGSMFNDKERNEMAQKGYGQIFFEARTVGEGYYIDGGSLYYNLEKSSVEDVYNWLCQRYADAEIDYM